MKAVFVIDRALDVPFHPCKGALGFFNPGNEKADLPPTGARGPRSGTEGAIGG